MNHKIILSLYYYPISLVGGITDLGGSCPHAFTIATALKLRSLIGIGVNDLSINIRKRTSWIYKYLELDHIIL